MRQLADKPFSANLYAMDIELSAMFRRAREL